MSRRSAVLLIHYYFPPIHSIGSKRNFYFAEEWDRQFEQVKVLSTSNVDVLPKDHTLLSSGFDIAYLPTKDYRTAMAKSSRRSSPDNINKSSPFWKLGVKLIHTYPFNLMNGEGGSQYIKAGVKEGTAFLQEHPDAIIYSSFRPYADHAIAAKLKAKFPKTTWIADFRDADVDPLYKLYLNKSWQESFNKRILRKADIITTVSDGVTTLVRQFHDNVHTVPTGVRLRPELDKFPEYTIAYTGSLYGEHRDPSPLMEAIRELSMQKPLLPDTFQLVYAGKDGKQFVEYARQYEVDHLVINHGIIPLQQAQEIQSKAHLNLMMTTATAEYQGILTGKLFEYIGANTPILSLVNGVEDNELNAMFEGYNLGHIHYTDLANQMSLNAIVTSRYEAYEQGIDTPSLAINKIKTTLSWEAQFNKILDLI